MEDVLELSLSTKQEVPRLWSLLLEFNYTRLANAHALKYNIGNYVWATRDELTLEDKSLFLEYKPKINFHATFRIEQQSPWNNQ